MSSSSAARAACGLRYPSPADDPRRDRCPLCAEPVVEVARFAPAPDHRPTEHTHPGLLVGVLDNVRSAVNVGAMLRSADGTALDHLHLLGLTAPGDHPKVTKTALGAQESVPWTSWLDGTECISHLRSEGYEVWAVDKTDGSMPLHDVREVPPRLAFVVGNERAGLDPAVLDVADRHVHLEMYGEKSTLNVGVAFGIAAYWLRTLTMSGVVRT